MHSVFNDFALNVKSLFNDNIQGSSNFQWNQCIENLVHKSTWDAKKVPRFSFSILYVFQIDQTNASSSLEVEQLILLKFCQWYTDDLEYNIDKI